MRQIYVVLDGIAVGPMEIDDDADILTAVKKKYPKAKRADPHEQDSNVIIVSTDE